MQTEIEAAIKNLVTKVTADVKAPDAINFTQAALNLAHTFATLEGAKKLK